MSSLKFFGLPIKEKGYKMVNSRGYLTYSRCMQEWAKEYDKSKYKKGVNNEEYKLLSIDSLYASYSYLNGSLKLVGINITFSHIQLV